MRILSISIIIALFIQGSQVSYALIFRLYSLFLHSRASRTMGCPSSSQEAGAHIVSWTGILSRMSIMQELQVFNLSMFTCFLVEEWAPRTMSTNLLASSDLQTIASSGLIYRPTHLLAAAGVLMIPIQTLKTLLNLSKAIRYQARTPSIYAS